MDATEYNQNDLDKISSLRVFNKDFVRDNLFQDNKREGESINPIFYLGDDNIVLQQERDRKLEKEGLLKTASDSELRALVNLEKNKEKNAKRIKDTFFGVHEFRFYNKSDYEKDFSALGLKIKSGESASDFLVNEQDFTSRLEAIKSNKGNKIDLSFVNDSFFNDINLNYLQKEISVSEIIESLRSNPSLSAWVQQGIHFHEGASECKFCGQNLHGNRLEKIKKHFDKTYQDFQSKITEKISSLKEKDNQSNMLCAVIQKLEEKKSNIFSAVTFSEEEKGDTLCLVSGYNESQENIINEGNTLKEALIAEDYTEQINLVEGLVARKTEVSEIRKEIEVLEQLIKEKEKEREDFQLPADELNQDIEFLLGHTDIAFSVIKEKVKQTDGTDQEEVYYQLKRNDEIANYLSEGEKTAISLIYFFKKLKHANEDLLNLILFIDDPISSMDSRLLFGAYAYITSNLSDERDNLVVSQFFISTHNYDLFNLLKKKYGKSSFYMLDLGIESSKRCSVIKPLDPLLRDNDSDYQYLFRMLVEYTKLSIENQRDLVKIYPYPNTGRRVLESFFSFKFPQCNLRDAIYKCSGLDVKEKESLYQFLHNHSHSKNQELLQTFSVGHLEPGVVKENLERILNKIIKVEDKNHYEGLIEKINL